MIRRVVLLLLLATGCQLTQAPTPTATAPAATATLTPPPSSTPTVSPPIAETGLLAWLGTGAAPTHASGGQIALIDRAGSVTPLIDVPNTATRVTACGDQATSPDGRHFAFYVGADSGSLYLMDSAHRPVMLDSISYLACLSGFQFAPDGARFGYIDYAANATQSDFAAGTLRLYDTDTLRGAAEFDNAVAFTLEAGGALFVSFYANAKGEADEASVSLWNGTTEREIVTLVPTDQDCRFTSAQIGQGGGQLLAMLGQRCTTGDTSPHWQLYTIDAAAGSATLVGTDAQPAAFVTFARTNNLYFAPNGSTAYFTVPDAVTAYTVAVAAVDLTSYAISVPIDRQAVFPNFSGAPDAFPRLSPDGRWLALVVTSPDNQNQIDVLDLNAPAATPISGEALGKGNLISDLAFTPGSDALIYLAGGVDNALYALDLSAGTERRVVRGNFAEGMAVSSDGKTVALLNIAHVDDPQQPAYLDLTLADLDAGTLTTLYPGADVADGKVSSLRFAYPLAWR